MRLDQLAKICPRCPVDELARQLPHLEAACLAFSIDSPARVAAFVAQCAHECNEMRSFEEIPWTDKATGKKYPDCYEGRKSLGNTQPGDGVRYKGRGVIQLTGRGNYRRYGQKLDLPLEIQPELLLRPEVSWSVAGCYWRDHGCNELADRAPMDFTSFDTITKAINGGLNGKPDRDAKYFVACNVLGVERVNA